MQGALAIVNFLLTDAPLPVLRAKMMLLGSEGVGKTTLVDTLFPFEGPLETQGMLLRTKYWGRLQGNTFAKFDTPHDITPHRNKLFALDSTAWKINASRENLSFDLQGRDRGEPASVYFCPDAQSFDNWCVKIKQALKRPHTKGVEVTTLVTPKEALTEVFKTYGLQRYSLEVSVWDTSGEQSNWRGYPNFFTPGTVFIIVWNLTARETDGLEYWLRVLSTHAVVAKADSPASILVIGTFLDHPQVKPGDKATRASKVDRLAQDMGLVISYFEMSNSGELETANMVREMVFQAILSRLDLKERPARTTLLINTFLQTLKQGPEPRQMITLEEINEVVGNMDLVRTSLRQLSRWGLCTYFETPAPLAAVVILGPGLLSTLRSSLKAAYSDAGLKDGIIVNSALVPVWPPFSVRGKREKDRKVLCAASLALLERLGVGFVMADDVKNGKPFDLQRTVIPELLGDRIEISAASSSPRNANFLQMWPEKQPPDFPVQIERVLKVYTLLSEHFDRVLFQLGPLVREDYIWRTEALLHSKEYSGSRAWVRAEMHASRVAIMVRSKSLDDANRLLEFLVSQVTEALVAANPTSPPPHRVLRSPHSAYADLRIEEVKVDTERSPETRKLACPLTGFPIRADLLLQQANSTTSFSPPSSSASPWWAYTSPSEAASTAPRSISSIPSSIIPVFEHDVESNRELFDKFKVLLAKTPSSLYSGEVVKVSFISSPKAQFAFDGKRDVFRRQLENSSHRPQSESWRNDMDKDQRNLYFFALTHQVSQFRAEFNDGSLPFLLPMFSGTTQEGAKQIADHGYASITPADDGYYGKGYYLSSDLAHATSCTPETSPGTGVKVCVLSLVLPGNPYPVTEVPTKGNGDPNPGSLVGQGCRPGYQSNYTVVTNDLGSPSYPDPRGDILNALYHRKVSDELVVFEPTQVLPLFIVQFRVPADRKGPPKTTRKEWVPN